jgi:hypothetical protein
MPDRVEREIEEILSKIDDFATEAPRIRAQRKQRERATPRIQPSANWLSRIGIGQLMLLSILLVLGSHFILGGFSSAAAQYGIIIGLVLFFSSFLLSFRPRVSAPQEKRWRGRIIEPESNRGWPRLGRWWRRR